MIEKICFWIAAIIMTVNTALEDAPKVSEQMPAWANFDLWGYVPLGFLIIGALAWAVGRIAAVFGWGRKHRKNIQAKTAGSLDKLMLIVGEEFVNTTVALDGHFYDYCRFDKVTFRWDGADFHLQNATLIAPCRFETLDRTSIITVDILKAFGLLSKDFASSWKHFDRGTR